MKIYDYDGEGGLKDVTKPGPDFWLRSYSDGVFVTEGAQMHVLVNDEDRGSWVTEDGKRVSMHNIHGTGELRWSERPRSMNPGGHRAAIRFKLTPANISPEEWAKVIDSHLIKIEDLSEVEVQMLEKAAADRDGIGSFVTHSSDPAPENSSMYLLQRKGLLVISISISCGDRTNQGYKITLKGRSVLKDGKA